MHHHLSGLEGLITVLYVLVIMGVLNLIAMKYQEKSNLAASYANLYGLS